MNAKRFFALLLALILCLTPLSALAEGEEPQDVDGGVSVYADGTDSKWKEVRNVTQTRDEYAGVSVDTNDRSIVQVTADCVTTSGGVSPGVRVSTGSESRAIVAAGTVTTLGDHSDGVRVIADRTSGVKAEVGNIKTEGDSTYGIVISARDASAVQVTTRSVAAVGPCSVGVQANAYSSEPTTVTVKGDVDATGIGVRANTSDGQATVNITVTGAVTGGTFGVDAYSIDEGSSTKIIVGKTDDAGVFAGSAVTGGDTGVVVEVGSGGQAEVRTGDVAGETNGVAVFSYSTGGTADILIDGTLSAGEQAVVVNEGTTEDELSLTVWKVEQEGEAETLVSGSGTGENAFTDASIQYIVRIDEGPRFKGQPMGSLSAAKDAEGTVLDTATSGEIPCGVAHEGDRVYLNMEYDTDKYEVIGAYVDEERKIEAQKDEDGRFFTEVSKGGGVFLSVQLREKQDHTPDDVVQEAEPAVGQAPDPFTDFCVNLAQLIMLAPENEVKEVDARRWYGLQWNVIRALADRPDVTLKITCWHDGVLKELTIPAGFDLMSSLEPGQFLHFNELVKLLG